MAGLRRGMRTRGLIEQAKGRLAERLGVGPDAAFAQLAQRSEAANVPVVDLAAGVMGAAEADLGPADVPRVVRVRSELDPAVDAGDLPALLADEVGLEPDAVALFAVEADGGLGLRAAWGWPPRAVAQWRWVPSAIRTPAGEALRYGAAWWRDDQPGPGDPRDQGDPRDLRDPRDARDPRDLLPTGPHPFRAAVPVGVRRRVVAVVELSWAERPDPTVRARLGPAAETLGRWLAGPGAVNDGGAEGDWIATVLETLDRPAAVLSPVWSDEAIVDFRIDWCNAALGAPVAHRLLEVEPGRLYDGTFDALVLTYHASSFRGHGSSFTGDATAAARLGTRLVATWPVDAAAATDPELVAAMEEQGQFGWGEWSMRGEPLACTAGLLRMLGRRPDSGPVPQDRVLAAVAEAHRASVRSTVEAGRRGQRGSTDVRVIRPDGVERTVRLVVTPRLDARGRIGSLGLLFQDRTDAERGERAAARDGDRLAEQRVQRAIERAQVRELRRAFLPPRSTVRHHGAASAVGRHVAPTGLRSFRGDFYDITAVNDRLLVTVGDVFGSGLPAAQTMVRLRHCARVLAMAGKAPAQVLTALNRDLLTDAEPPLASLVLATIGPDGAGVVWAQAGHYSPILVRRGRARAVPRPAGDALGLRAGSRYTQRTIRLGPGDLLVCFTDGVFQQWDLARLVDECERAQLEGGLAALVERLLPPVEDEACLVALSL